MNDNFFGFETSFISFGPRLVVNVMPNLIENFFLYYFKKSNEFKLVWGCRITLGYPPESPVAQVVPKRHLVFYFNKKF